jgi:glycerol-3-phosphate acyltransferase PlsX
VKIALDAMGGDYAPRATVEGAVAAARELGISVVLVGDRAKLTKELEEHKTTGLNLVIEHAAEVVTMEDSALESILVKHDSSMHVSYDLLKRGEVDAVVSAGNSGAMMAAAMVILGTLPGVDRPAIASLVPSSDGFALLIDAGANTEVKPFNLVQFAVMGSLYAHHVLKLARPRVGILSNGEEESKGTDVTRSAAATLRSMPNDLNYIGYVEGRDINVGKVDVVVTDGFTGNVMLKLMEGFAQFAFGNLREMFSPSVRGSLAYLLIRKRLSALRERFDKSEYGGAPLMGVNGVAIVAHGSSNARAIRNALRSAATEALIKHVNPAIVEMLARVPMDVPFKGKGMRALFNRVRERLHRHNREGDRTKPAPSPAEDDVIRTRTTGPLGRPGEDKLTIYPAEPLIAETASPPVNGASAPAAAKPSDEAATGSESRPPKNQPS